MKHTLPNPIIANGTAKAIDSERVARLMERNEWYMENMQRLVTNYRVGHVESVVFANVAQRLNRIATHRTEVA